MEAGGWSQEDEDGVGWTLEWRRERGSLLRDPHPRKARSAKVLSDRGTGGERGQKTIARTKPGWPSMGRGTVDESLASSQLTYGSGQEGVCVEGRVRLLWVFDEQAVVGWRGKNGRGAKVRLGREEAREPTDN